MGWKKNEWALNFKTYSYTNYYKTDFKFNLYLQWWRERGLQQKERERERGREKKKRDRKGECTRRGKRMEYSEWVEETGRRNINLLLWLINLLHFKLRRRRKNSCVLSWCVWVYIFLLLFDIFHIGLFFVVVSFRLPSGRCW